MWLSDVSVKRPVLATVINALLLVFGLYALFSLSVREYPDIDPPVVSVETRYPGAAAPVVETRITQVLEEQIAGIEGIRSLNSQSSDGRSRITIEFSLARDVDNAANDVRDRISRVLNQLPDEADPPEVTKADSDASPIIWTVLTSDRLGAMELTAFADRHIVDRYSALDGVSAVRIGGERKPAMRIWLDRRALAARNLTVQDVESALAAQNLERPAGKIESAEREFTLRTARSFTTPEQFAQLTVARGANGYPISLGDIARVEVAPADLNSLFRANGKPAVGLGVIKQSTANTLSVAQAVKREMAEIAKTLPEGMSIRVNSDFSLFIEASLHEVVVTLVIAALLVVLVIFLFLGDWRATLIPAATVPISLVSSLLFLLMFGFSINILTLLAMVLAIGLVVDDTIVVVENIHRRMHAGETPLVASFNGAREVGFAIVATTAVLIAVFTPLAFLQGNIGRLFSEFALALAGSVFCSGVVALTLSPVLCSLLLRNATHEAGQGTGLTGAIDRAMLAAGTRYCDRLTGFLDRPRYPVMLLGALLIGIVALFWYLPNEFTPREDRGQFQVQATAPEGASFDYTARYLTQIEGLLLANLRNETHPQSEIDRFLVRVPGFGSNSVNSGMAMVSLVDWKERGRTTDEVAALLSRELAKMPGITARAAQRSGFGGGYGQPLQMVVAGGDWTELALWRDKLLARITMENPDILRPDSDYRETKPTLDVALDLARAADLGVSVESVSHTLETLLAGRSVTTWQQDGEEYDVMLQAAPSDRATPGDLDGIHVRSATSGAMVPLGNLLITHEAASAATLNHYDRLRAVTISAGLAPGYTLGEAVDYLEKIAAEELPVQAVISWKGDARELAESSNAMYLTFAMALLVVFLVLAAQFENWIHPLVIMTTVPLALFGGLAALAAFGYSLNIYSQIGLVMLIGLAAKNGILIVEFANQRRDAGVAFRDAILESAQVRLRPILMTSLATAAGAVPLMISSGAGSEARANLGLVVFWGVLFSTFLMLVVVPAMYTLLCRNTGSPGARAARLEREM